MGQTVLNSISQIEVQYIDLLCFLNSIEETGEQVWLVDKNNKDIENNACIVDYDGFYKGIGQDKNMLEENLVSAIYQDTDENIMELVIKEGNGIRNYLLEVA